MPETTPTTGPIKARWQKLDTERLEHLSRQRECSELTIPSLLPPENSNPGAKLPTPWQSLGARGCNFLSNKLLLILFPPNFPFFRLKLDTKLENLLTSEGQPPGLKTEVEEGLVKTEGLVMTEIETSTLRVNIGEALLHDIVTGNSLLYLPDDGGARTYPLDAYVCKRDGMGNLIELIIKESVHFEALPDAIKRTITDKEKNKDDSVDVFTHVQRVGKKWQVKQEAAGQFVPGSDGSYPLDDLPWLQIPWKLIRGEDYGRGLVEEYLGDLVALEDLTKSVVLFAKAASKILIMVNPNGVTDADELTNSESGDVVSGIKDDVTLLQLEKYYDFQVAQTTIADIKLRLEQAFMLMSSIQRDAERVTAQEIREMATDLESGLGGVYASLSQTLQLPLLRRLMKQMNKQKKLPKLPKDALRPMIITGLDALGRGNDFTKVSTFLATVQALGPEAQGYLKYDAIMKQLGNSLGVDTKDIVLTPEEMQQKQQQAMMAEAMKGIGPKIAEGAMNANATTNQEASTGTTG